MLRESLISGSHMLDVKLKIKKNGSYYDVKTNKTKKKLKITLQK